MSNVDVFLRFGYRDSETSDGKWCAKQDWDGLPYEALVAMQAIMHEAEGKMLELGRQAVQLKAARPQSGSSTPRGGQPG